MMPLISRFIFRSTTCLIISTLIAFTTMATQAADVKVETDIPYLGPDRAEKGDLYLPGNDDGKKLRPAIVIIHGGGWTGGDKAAGREKNIGGTLAAQGYVCLSINYLLQKTDGPPIWPQNLHDCKTAVRWLRANAERLRIDTRYIGAIGGSAGGHLVSMLGVTGPEVGLDPPGPYGEHSCQVQAVVNLYGSMANKPGRTYSILGKSPAEAPELYRQVTPLSHIDKSDAPVLILHGTADTTVPVSESEAFAAALKKGGVEHELMIIPDAPHTFHLQPKQRDLRPVVISFFNKHLKPTATK